MNIHDLVLEWLSEIGQGDWDDVRDGIANLKLPYPGFTTPSWAVASDLELCGHIDIDWRARRWSVSCPARGLLPGTSLCAVWTGARPRALQKRLEAQLENYVSVFDFRVAGGDGPTAHFVKAACADDLRRVAEEVGLRFVVDPARHLASQLATEDWSLTDRAAGPAEFEEFEWFDAPARNWVRTSGAPRQPGLYQFDRYGKVTRWRDEEGSWWLMERANGMFRAAREGGLTGLLCWRAPARDRSEPARLELVNPYILPKLAGRAAVASSGLLPRRTPACQEFYNVQRGVAESIARSLGQAAIRVEGDSPRSQERRPRG